jgi:hypothetical protein
VQHAAAMLGSAAAPGPCGQAGGKGGSLAGASTGAEPLEALGAGEGRLRGMTEAVLCLLMLAHMFLLPGVMLGERRQRQRRCCT